MKKKHIAKRIFVFICFTYAVFSCSDASKSVYTKEKSSQDRLHENKNSRVKLIKPYCAPEIINIKVPGIVAYNSKTETSVFSRIDGRIEKVNVLYNYQSVKRGELLYTVHSPELLAAQRELLLNADDPENKTKFEASIQKIKTLGMSQKEIHQLIKTKTLINYAGIYSPMDGYIYIRNSENSEQTTINLRPGSYLKTGDKLFDIYGNKDLAARFYLNDNYASYVKAGDMILYKSNDSKDYIKSADINILESGISDSTKSIIAKTFSVDPNLRPGQILTIYIPIVLVKSCRLPISSVSWIGNRAVVYKKEDDKFAVRRVEVILQNQGFVYVRDNIGVGEIALNASSMSDSESFIKPAEINK